MMNTVVVWWWWYFHGWGIKSTFTRFLSMIQDAWPSMYCKQHKQCIIYSIYIKE